MDERITVLLTDRPLSLDAAFGAVRLPECGGTALFVGTTRSPSEGRVVDQLEYEAYAEMARRELRRVAVAAVARHGLGAVYLAHRTGVVPAGEASVVVAASAPHRAEAFAGCRALIDELKRTVPIWKKERWEGGGRWVGAPEAGAEPAGAEPAGAGEPAAVPAGPGPQAPASPEVAGG